jgi:hypothetical protein
MREESIQDFGGETRRKETTRWTPELVGTTWRIENS